MARPRSVSARSASSAPSAHSASSAAASASPSGGVGKGKFSTCGHGREVSNCMRLEIRQTGAGRKSPANP